MTIAYDFAPATAVQERCGDTPSAYSLCFTGIGVCAPKVAEETFVTWRNHGVPAEEERSDTRDPEEPERTKFPTDVVAPAAKRSFVPGDAAVKVPVVEAEFAKITEGSVCASVPEVFKTVRLLNAEDPVALPETVCWLVPERYTVPAPAVNVPLLV